ncbi:8-oxo-dGTP pyrophosphatase MutT, NUDIX family [Tistlia consotensis]|uniref:8-oxo-dGTP pyrophosphatase MutT, NUDIX family n=1 Tax=Tistlia consotensis USBA 355 TaxID=560819 RepID=A0A1Y6CG93_9PROT|nr:NUDIX hydrolase [Tistlia consotensis]SMF60242.1 8-oxo-dGTP pyrophosphatase MutT, NUDIX family [Tistlia consotensis USBA 355]SNR93677.1 8-oxo-dGTP pyrophosphatase MutT, NUDIX family [Tistlia consotensis]
MQCYLLPYAITSQATYVALGKKVLLQWKVDGGTLDFPFVPHSAGQWAFSGGKKDGNDKTSAAAADREFLEETGIDLSSGSNWAKKSLRSVDALLYDDDRVEFFVSYVCFGFGDLKNLAKAIRDNIDGTSPDDLEFSTFSVFEVGDALSNQIGPAPQPKNGDWRPMVYEAVGTPGQFNTTIPNLVSRLAKETLASSDWYQMALADLQEDRHGIFDGSADESEDEDEEWDEHDELAEDYLRKRDMQQAKSERKKR